MPELEKLIYLQEKVIVEYSKLIEKLIPLCRDDIGVIAMKDFAVSISCINELNELRNAEITPEVTEQTLKVIKAIIWGEYERDMQRRMGIL